VPVDTFTPTGKHNDTESSWKLRYVVLRSPKYAKLRGRHYELFSEVTKQNNERNNVNKERCVQGYSGGNQGKETIGET